MAYEVLTGNGAAGVYDGTEPRVGLQSMNKIRNSFIDHEARLVTLAASGAGDVAGPAASVASEIALYDGTTGKLIKRATGTGYVKVTSGVMGTPVATVPLATDVSGNLPLANLPTNFAQIFRATVTLTDTQTKALPTTGITLVAAPAAGFHVRALAGTLVIRNTGGVYTNVNTAYATLQVQTAGGVWLLTPIANDSTLATPLARLTTFLNTSHNLVCHLGQYLEAIQSGGGAGDWGYLQPATAGVSDVDAVAVEIKADNNGSGNFTGGHAANTLKATIYYGLEAL